MYKIKVDASHVFEVSKADCEALDAVETKSNHYHTLADNQSVKANFLLIFVIKNIEHLNENNLRIYSAPSA